MDSSPDVDTYKNIIYDHVSEHLENDSVRDTILGSVDAIQDIHAKETRDMLKELKIKSDELTSSITMYETRLLKREEQRQMSIKTCFRNTSIYQFVI